MSEPHNQQPTDLLDRRSVRLGLFVVVPLALSALVAAAVHVSMLGIDHTILVFGDRQLRVDDQAALRLTLMSDQGGLFVPDRVEGSLSCGGEPVPLPLSASSERSLFPARTFTVPASASGQCRVGLELRFSDKRQRVSYDVEILSNTIEAEALTVPVDVPEGSRPFAVMVGGQRIEVFTEDRGAPTGLGSVLFLRATQDESAPVSTDLALRRPQNEEWDEVRTDKLGLLALPLRPFDMSARLTVRGARRAGAVEHEALATQPGQAKIATAAPAARQEDAQLEPLVVYSGIGVAVHNPLANSHEPVRLTLHQLSQAGPVIVDAFRDGRYMAGFSSEFRGGRAELALRLPGSGLYRLQIAATAFSTERSVAVRHVYVMSESETPNEALRHLLGRLSSSEADRRWAAHVLEQPLERGVGFDRQTLAAFVLSRLYQGYRPLERLVSSRKADDQELKRFQFLFQRGVMFAILLLGLGVAALTTFIALGAARRQRRMTLMILNEPEPHSGDGDLWHTEQGRTDYRWRTALSAAILFFIIVGAFVSLAVLVVVLRWFG